MEKLTINQKRKLRRIFRDKIKVEPFINGIPVKEYQDWLELYAFQCFVLYERNNPKDK